MRTANTACSGYGHVRVKSDVTLTTLPDASQTGVICPPDAVQLVPRTVTSLPEPAHMHTLHPLPVPPEQSNLFKLLAEVEVLSREK